MGKGFTDRDLFSRRSKEIIADCGSFIYPRPLRYLWETIAIWVFSRRLRR